MGKVIGWFAVVVCGLFFVLWLVGTLATEPLTPEQQATKTLADLRVFKTAKIASILKETLRDPDSVVWEALLADETAQNVCIQYRARNGFGGMSREVLILSDGQVIEDQNAWGARCRALAYDMQRAEYAIK